MKRHPVIFSAYKHKLSLCYLYQRSARKHLLYICIPSSSFGSSGVRPFPDYSPRKPSIRDIDLVHRITTTIKQRQYETFHRILKPFEANFRTDHLIWVLMEIKDNYSLVVNLFHCSCIRTRRDPSLEARCIVIQIAVAANDIMMVQNFCHGFWSQANIDSKPSMSSVCIQGMGFRSFCFRPFFSKTLLKMDSKPSMSQILKKLVYNALIKGFIKRKKYSEAREHFEEMRKKELSVDKELYSHLQI